MLLTIDYLLSVTAISYNLSALKHHAIVVELVTAVVILP